MAYSCAIFKTLPEEEQLKLTAAFQHWLRPYAAAINVHPVGPAFLVPPMGF
jgi:hypothetical protein